MNILMKILPKVESKWIKKHKFQFQTTKLENEIFLKLAEQANSKSASNHHWPILFQHTAKICK